MILPSPQVEKVYFLCIFLISNKPPSTEIQPSGYNHYPSYHVCISLISLSFIYLFFVYLILIDMIQNDRFLSANHFDHFFHFFIILYLNLNEIDHFFDRSHSNFAFYIFIILLFLISDIYLISNREIKEYWKSFHFSSNHENYTVPISVSEIGCRHYI